MQILHEFFKIKPKTSETFYPCRGAALGYATAIQCCLSALSPLLFIKDTLVEKLRGNRTNIEEWSELTLMEK